jgi:kojibiose phosphorylase
LATHSIGEDDGWTLVESPFDVRFNRHFEGLLAIGSGPLQQRASLEEGLSHDPQDVEYLRVMGNVTIEKFPAFKSRVGTYMPGVSGPHPTCLDEMVNLPALHGLFLFAGSQRLDMEHSRIREYARRLDLRTGRLSRSFTWETCDGARLAVRFERFISAARPHVMALLCEIRHAGAADSTPDGAAPSVELRMIGTLDGDVRTNGFDHFESIEITGEHEPITVAIRTNSGIIVGAAALMTSDASIKWSVEMRRRWAGLSGVRRLEPGRALRITKFAAMTSTWHGVRAPVDAARKLAWDAAALGYDALAAESDEIWRRRWAATDVEIEGDPRSRLALRASIYHLLRAASESDPRVAIDAKAAAGEAYCGRFFWDTEIFILPMFLYTRPEVGCTLARFRFRSLDGARRNAKRYGYSGARYAWESSPAGDENCPNWQYRDHEVHVTADAAYGLLHAYAAAPDLTLLAETVEVLIETSRYWRQRVTYDADRDRYELLMVMGPNEYTPFSRNNAYTNHLGSYCLSATRRMWEELRRTSPELAESLRRKLAFVEDELARFDDVAGKLASPYDASRRLVLQSDEFFDYEALDFAHWWPDRSQPLGRTVSQERLYRSRVLKQADVVQLLALFPDRFDREQMRIAYETYEPLTCHDSSLSRSMHAIVAAWIGREDEALRMWDESVGLDLSPGAAAEGIHAACAGANWQAAVFGFGGVRTAMQSDVLVIEPHLPKRWSRLRFPLVWKGQPLRITIEHGGVTVEHAGDRAIAARIFGLECDLAPRSARTCAGA